MLKPRGNHWITRTEAHAFGTHTLKVNNGREERLRPKGRSNQSSAACSNGPLRNSLRVASNIRVAGSKENTLA